VAASRSSLSASDWLYIERSERRINAVIEIAAKRAGSNGIVEMAHFGADRIAEQFGDVDFEMEDGVLGSLLSAQADVLLDAQRF